jgi:hypothetical protein
MGVRRKSVFFIEKHPLIAFNPTKNTGKPEISNASEKATSVFHAQAICGLGVGPKSELFIHICSCSLLIGSKTY